MTAEEWAEGLHRAVEVAQDRHRDCVTAELDLGRTRAALVAFDAHNGKTVRIDGEDGWWERHDTLLIGIGAAFATDTADRNDSDTASSVSGCGGGLKWLRRLCDDGENTHE